ncbi:hypothetical protein PHYPSEUDO_009624 [Phytophthora pseudosyringae]|uniref:Uncharacterized protein n=1 Tax=Phytophthora pseudosyringae TaxID=221518 RepID=A0A8T1WNC4_9STRA|nr:hypothetical protein PHYPSEUDO_009624 [Phytophthora pseudosyringae]
MLSFGTRKKCVEEWTKYDLLEEEAFALLESILEDEHGEAVSRAVTDAADLDERHDERGEEEAFAFLESICIEDDSPDNYMYECLLTEKQRAEKEVFALPKRVLEDSDEPSDHDILAHSLKEHQPQGVDPLEMKKLEDAAFALLETIFEDDDDKEILFPVHKRN